MSISPKPTKLQKRPPCTHMYTSTPPPNWTNSNINNNAEYMFPFPGTCYPTLILSTPPSKTGQIPAPQRPAPPVPSPMDETQIKDKPHNQEKRRTLASPYKLETITEKPGPLLTEAYKTHLSLFTIHDPTSPTPSPSYEVIKESHTALIALLKTSYPDPHLTKHLARLSLAASVASPSPVPGEADAKSEAATQGRAWGLSQIQSIDSQVVGWRVVEELMAWRGIVFEEFKEDRIEWKVWKNEVSWIGEEIEKVRFLRGLLESGGLRGGEKGEKGKEEV